MLLTLGVLLLLGQDPALVGQGRAFVEIVAERDTWFVGEPIAVRLRVGVDRDFLAASGIQVFQRRLDVPVHVRAGWGADWPGTRVLRSAPATGGQERLTLAVDDGVVAAARAGDRVDGGVRLTMLELVRRVVAEAPGELALPAPQLRFAFATRFTDDFVQGRVPADRHEAVVDGHRLVLRIVALPEAGKPVDFAGAVGRFRITAEAAPRSLELGQTLKLTLRIEGDGNLELCPPPVLDDLAGFHAYGKIDDRDPARRTIVYDLAPASLAVRAVPAIRFSFFDPGSPAGYRTVATEPIAIEVREGPGGAEAASGAARGVPGVDDILDLKPVGAAHPTGARRPPVALFVAALLAPWLAALGLACFLRARARAAADHDGRRARAAAGALVTRSAAPGADLAAELTEYLAARLRCPSAAVITPDLAARLEAAHVPAELAGRAAAQLERLGAARYGGRAASDDAAGVRALVAEIEAAFLAAQARR